MPITSAITPAWRPATRERARSARRRMARIAQLLAKTYETPDLGNVEDPLDEAVYILLTYQTDIPRARQVWTALRRAFPSWQAALDVPEAELEEILRPSGFQRARTRLVRALLTAVVRRWGALSLAQVKTMGDEDAEAALRKLPGLDIKGARCVMMYSLGRKVFPVDSNAFRFMRRYGILKRSAVYRRRATHDQIQEVIPPGLRKSLHVNLVAHGQMTCLPGRPLCARCAVRRGCQEGSRRLRGERTS